MARLLQSTLPLLLLASLAGGPARAQEKVVIQYGCISSYANWGGVTSLDGGDPRRRAVRRPGRP